MASSLDNHPGALSVGLLTMISGTPIPATLVHPLSGERSQEEMAITTRVRIMEVLSLRTPVATSPPTEESYAYYVEATKAVTFKEFQEAPGSVPGKFPHTYLTSSTTGQQPFAQDIWTEESVSGSCLNCNASKGVILEEIEECAFDTFSQRARLCVTLSLASRSRLEVDIDAPTATAADININNPIPSPADLERALYKGITFEHCVDISLSAVPFLFGLEACRFQFGGGSGLGSDETAACASRAGGCYYW
ncbi:hypothetical protein DFP72DRAFT_1047730 [Ephemerocybe angulata]|uniref:Uncharacterized protein n=1 Tax=Ephemerocybe angulata TaxID=980116 RepID=A0A8H6HTG9_9AGAR|nr:hypothetical protein DFP72DRAFT_1047730 [Tulosesus angulatus]